MIDMKPLIQDSQDKIYFLFEAVMILVSDYSTWIISKQYSFRDMFYTQCYNINLYNKE